MKYYIPSIEEFYIGFELEIYVDAVKGWRTLAIRDGRHLDFVLKEIKNNNVRVKILDKEDIESLGWKLSTEFGHKNYYRLKDFGLTERFDIHEEFYPNLLIYEKEYNDVPYRVFTGKVKNKSEFKNLLKMLRI